MTKRAHGEGTIFQDKNNAWWAQLPSDEHGKRPKRKAATQRAARDLLREMQRERERGRNLSLQSPTVEAFLKTWLEEIAKPKVKPRTYEDYKGKATLHIIRRIGRYRLDKLTPALVQKLLNDLGEHLSSQSVKHVRRILYGAFDVAVKWGYISRNVVALVEPPRVERKPVVPLTVDEARLFLDSVQGQRLELLYIFAIWYGLRQGELLGLRWIDFDRSQGTLKVTGTVQYIDGTLRRENTPKTKSSVRTIYLPDELLEALQLHWDNQQQERRVLGTDWKEHGLIFPSEVGTPIWASNLVHPFKAALKRAGLPTSTRFHDLRHSAASIMLAQGVPLTTVSNILGHSSVAITGDIYGHVYDSDKLAAAQQVGRVLGRKKD